MTNIKDAHANQLSCQEESQHHFSKRPKTTFVYVQVTKTSDGQEKRKKSGDYRLLYGNKVRFLFQTIQSMSFFLSKP